MRAISILLAFAALITGLVGAVYWFKSSIVPIDRWGREEHPGPFAPHELQAANTLYVGGRSRRGGGWNWVGVVSGLFNPNDSGVGALERRPRHDKGYHEGGGCRRRGFAFR